MVEELDLEPVREELKKVVDDEELIEVLLDPDNIDATFDWFDKKKGK